MSQNFCKPFDYMDTPQSANLMQNIGYQPLPRFTEQQNRVSKVVQRIERLVLEDDSYAAMFAEALEPVLNEMLDSDAFGTEGQLDPRGDPRNGAWSMNCVEGLDIPPFVSGDACDVCNGDCAGANPSVTNCPSKA